VLGVERIRGLFPFLLLVLPAKFLIVGRTVAWSELAGAVLACTCSYFLSRFCGRLDRDSCLGAKVVEDKFPSCSFEGSC
jgi:hypothetical protein